MLFYPHPKNDHSQVLPWPTREAVNQYNDTQLNGNEHNNKLNAKLSITTLSVMVVMLGRMSFMLIVVYPECRKQTHYAECRYAKCRYAECRYAKCRSAPCLPNKKGSYQGPCSQHLIFFVTYEWAQ